MRATITRVSEQTAIISLQHYLTGSYNRDGVCLLRGMNWIFEQRWNKYIMLHVCIFQTKCLNNFAGPSVFLQDKVKNCTSCNIIKICSSCSCVTRQFFLVGELGVEGPRRSPSLTVCSSFLWGWAREKASRPQPRTLDEVGKKTFHILKPPFPSTSQKMCWG